MANILFISYDYPPVLSPESIQVNRRALTLAKNSHKVFILSIHYKPAFEFIDISLLQKHKNIEIFRTKKPFFEKALNFLSKLFGITDRKFWWQYYAFNHAKEIIENNGIDIIYSHSTPLVDHIVAYKLKKEFPKIKWIAHFSDPWTLNPYIKYSNSFVKKLNKRFEKNILLKSDTVTLTSEKTKELFLENYDFLNTKIHILPHVFDKSLFCLNRKKDKKIIVSHTGNIYGLRTIKYFLEALNEIEINDIEFYFYGKIKESERKLIKKYGLQEMVKIYEQIPYLKSLEIISKSDFLLLVDAPLDNSPFFPSKLADYIGANKPIIALTPVNSASRDILKHIGNDIFMASPEKKEEIKYILRKLMNFDDNISFKNVKFYDMNNYTLLKEVFER